RGSGEEDAEVIPGAGFGGADGADDLRSPAVHAGGALRCCGRKDQPSCNGWPGQRNLLRDEAADGESQEINLAEVQGGDEGGGVGGDGGHVTTFRFGSFLSCRSGSALWTAAVASHDICRANAAESAC